MCWRSRSWRAHDGSIGWNDSIANSSALFAPYLEPGCGAPGLRRSARDLRLGTAQRFAGRSRCRAAIASPAAGISPAAAARRAGWARTAPWSSRTARCASTVSAGRRSAPGCFRPSRRPCSTIGTRSGCAARRRNPTRSTICSCPRNSPARARTRRCAASAGKLYAFPQQTPVFGRRSPASRSASPAACSKRLSSWPAARLRAAPAGSPTTR